MTAALDGTWHLAARARRADAAPEREHTQTELARMAGLDKTTMVVTLDELEATGLAERRPSSRDRRARVIAVTEAGKRKVAEADDITERIRADVLGALPDGRAGGLHGCADPRWSAGGWPSRSSARAPCGAARLARREDRRR